MLIKVLNILRCCTQLSNEYLLRGLSDDSVIFAFFRVIIAVILSINSCLQETHPFSNIMKLYQNLHNVYVSSG